MHDPIDLEETKETEEAPEIFPDSLTFFESELFEALEHATDPPEHEEDDK